MLAASLICTSTTGMSPDTEWPHKLDWPRRFFAITAAGARIAEVAYRIEPARRSNNCASDCVAFNCRSKTWLCVQARSNTRSAKRRSRYFSINPMQA